MTFSDPNHPRAAGNVKWYEDMLLEEGIRKGDMGDLPPVVNTRQDDNGNLPERDVYEALCRGEVISVSYYSMSFVVVAKFRSNRHMGFKFLDISFLVDTEFSNVLIIWTLMQMEHF